MRKKGYCIILTVFATLLCMVLSPSSFARRTETVICYKLMKTVDENGKEKDMSKTNTIRYFLFYDGYDESHPDHSIVVASNRSGTPLLDITNGVKFDPRDMAKFKLKLIDSPTREYYNYVSKERTKSGVVLYECTVPDCHMIFRVSADRSVFNIYYRENKLKNIYVTDVYERIEDPGSDIIR